MSSQRPSFTHAWTSFSQVHGSVENVGSVIGGKVKTNIDAGIFTNACAIRMSYVFNQTGFSIPSNAGAVSSGAKGEKYLFRVSDLSNHIETRFGKPDYVQNNPNLQQFLGKKGILLFEVSGWNDATGHVTLWNGTTCSDTCYFARATRAKLWVLQ